MNRTLAIFYTAAAVAAAVMASGCAKESGAGANDAGRRYFDAWITVHWPDVDPTPLGCYVIEDIPGDGPLIGDASNAPFLYGTYTQRALNDTVVYTSDRALAKQTGSFDTTYWYGNSVWARVDSAQMAGIDEALTTMRTGGRRTVVIPSWLMTYTRYSDASEYLKHSSGYDHSILTLSVSEIIKDVEAWEIDSLKRFVDRHYPGTDSTAWGFYYIRTQAPDDSSETFDQDEKVYLNYIGRRLDGQVFDCTIKDTARKYNIYKASSTYEETYVKWDTTAHTGLTLGSNESSVIPGFSKALFGMRSGEKGIAIFYSGLGYGSSSAGQIIPEYCPLMFELEMKGPEEEDE